jgi:hypothetical protein
MKTLKSIIAALALAAFLTVGVFGMIAMTGHHHEPGCPFMPGEQAICQMDVFDHISAWQEAFTAVVPSLIILLLAVAVVFYVWQREWPPDIPARVYLRPEQQDRIANLYQELFSRGILNPKIP